MLFITANVDAAGKACEPSSRLCPSGAFSSLLLIVYYILQQLLSLSLTQNVDPCGADESLLVLKQFVDLDNPRMFHVLLDTNKRRFKTKQKKKSEYLWRCWELSCKQRR